MRLDIPFENAELVDVPTVIGNPWHGKLVMPSGTYSPATLHLEGGGTRTWPRPLSQSETVYLIAPDAPAAPDPTPDESAQGMEWRNYLLYGALFPYATAAAGQYDGIDVMSRAGPWIWLWQPTHGHVYRVALSLGGITWERIGVFGHGAVAEYGGDTLTWPDGVVPEIVDITQDGGSVLLYAWNKDVLRIDMSYAGGVVSASLSTVLAKTSTQSPYFGDDFNSSELQFKPLGSGIYAGSFQTLTWLLRPYFDGSGAVAQLWVEWAYDDTYTITEFLDSPNLYPHNASVETTLTYRLYAGGDIVTKSSSWSATVYNDGIDQTTTSGERGPTNNILPDYAGVYNSSVKSLYLTVVGTDAAGIQDVISKSPLTGDMTLHASVGFAQNYAYHPATGELVLDDDNLVGWI